MRTKLLLVIKFNCYSRSIACTDIFSIPSRPFMLVTRGLFTLSLTGCLKLKSIHKETYKCKTYIVSLCTGIYIIYDTIKI